MSARLEAAPTFYVDESSDEIWLSHCGRHSYLALTRDQRIRYRPLERLALMEHGVACFTFTQGQATAAQCAARIHELMPKMTAVAASQSRPFLYTFGLAGGLAKVTLRGGRIRISRGS